DRQAALAEGDLEKFGEADKRLTAAVEKLLELEAPQDEQADALAKAQQALLTARRLSPRVTWRSSARRTSVSPRPSRSSWSWR
ncbi:hypothetical protein CTI14_67310, partial [Methylobacterium radiotolerans]